MTVPNFSGVVKESSKTVTKGVRRAKKKIPWGVAEAKAVKKPKVKTPAAAGFAANPRDLSDSYSHGIHRIVKKINPDLPGVLDPWKSNKPVGEPDFSFFKDKKRVFLKEKSPWDVSSGAKQLKTFKEKPPREYRNPGKATIGIDPVSSEVINSSRNVNRTSRIKQQSFTEEVKGSKKKDFFGGVRSKFAKKPAGERTVKVKAKSQTDRLSARTRTIKQATNADTTIAAAGLVTFSATSAYLQSPQGKERVNKVKSSVKSAYGDVSKKARAGYKMVYGKWRRVRDKQTPELL